jgi:aquaporin Z
MRDSFRPALAELIGTFAFVFVGAGAVVVDRATNGGLGLLGIALAHGLAFSVFVSVTMPISGGHLNPAVSVGLFAAGKINGRTTLIYVAAQLLAALFAALMLQWVMPAVPADAVGLGVPRLAPTITLSSGIALEATITFFLLIVVFGTAVSPSAPKMGGFGIGLAVACGVFVAGPLTGAAMNPARAFGPAVVANVWRAHAAFWIGPMVGALAAAAVWRFLLREEPAREGPSS